MIVAIVGHRKIEKTELLKSRLERAIIGLIESGADTFLFGSRGQFDELCYGIVTKLKERYALKRVYVRAAFRFINEQYENYLLSLYEETVFPPSVIDAGRISYIKRNEAMIDACGVLLTYYDENYVPKAKEKSNSGTAIAFKYALGRHKRILNIKALTV